MATISIVGVKGSGKTTVARRLTDSSERLRYVYMGFNVESANIALPTTYAARAIKRWRRRNAARGGRRSGKLSPTENLADRRGPALALARLVNRLGDQLLRHAVSSLHQLRGFLVVYDRHVYFETAHGAATSARRSDRILQRIAATVLPRPDRIVFLDAPPEQLVDRSGGVDVETLRRRRQLLKERLDSLPHFVTVDATRPIDEVVAQVRKVVNEPE